jgi:hypothetical protein
MHAFFVAGPVSPYLQAIYLAARPFLPPYVCVEGGPAAAGAVDEAAAVQGVQVKAGPSLEGFPLQPASLQAPIVQAPLCIPPLPAPL